MTRRRRHKRMRKDTRIILPETLGDHNCGDGFKGNIIKTKKGIYCSFCGQMFPDGITPLAVKNGIAKKVKKR